MKVSIVIPAYNEEENISRTIAAVLAQDYPDFEVIVVDNASTDRTAEIVAGFPITLVHEPRKGLLYARECGRRHAKGEIIANVDADCLPASDWLSRGAALFEKDSAIAVSGPYDYYDLDLPLRSFLRFGFFWSWVMNKIFQLPFVGMPGVLVGGNNLIRVETLKQTGGYNTDIEFWGEDTDTAKRISKYGYILFDFDFIMPTSGRRFKREGVWNVCWKYFTSYFTARK